MHFSNQRQISAGASRPDWLFFETRISSGLETESCLAIKQHSPQCKACNYHEASRKDRVNVNKIPLDVAPSDLERAGLSSLQADDFPSGPVARGKKQLNRLYPPSLAKLSRQPAVSKPKSPTKAVSLVQLDNLLAAATEIARCAPNVEYSHSRLQYSSLIISLYENIAIR